MDRVLLPDHDAPTRRCAAPCCYSCMDTGVTADLLQLHSYMSPAMAGDILTSMHKGRAGEPEPSQLHAKRCTKQACIISRVISQVMLRMRCHACVQYPEPEQGGARMRRPLRGTQSCAAVSRLASCGLSRTVRSVAAARTLPRTLALCALSVPDCCSAATPLQAAAHVMTRSPFLHCALALQPVLTNTGCKSIL